MFIVDGTLFYGGGSPGGSMFRSYLPLVEQRLLVPSPLLMTASYSIADGRVSLTVDVTADAVLTGQNRLDFFVCQNGVGDQSNLVVDMLASEPFSLTDPGQSVTVRREFAFSCEWTTNALRLVVIVQNLITGEVLQTALAGVRAPTETPLEDGAAALAHRAWPNPFGPSTTIGFSLSRAGRTSLEVFGLDGRLVRTLLYAPLEAGEHQVVWRGDDETGRRLATGTYFYRLQLDGEPPRTGRMVLLR